MCRSYNSYLGIETNFGEKLGAYRVVDTLATLAFGAEGEQRKALFKSELSALEEIKNKKGIEIDNLFGSWAGAFGHAIHANNFFEIFLPI